MFRFRLEPLLKHRRHLRDLRLQLLAQVLAEAERMEAEKAQLAARRLSYLEEIRQMTQERVVDIDGATTRRYHASRTVAQVALLDQQAAILKQQEQLCRQAVSKADQGVRMLEKLRERSEREFRRDAERRSQLVLEDAWRSTSSRERP